ncbi:hypothetical protein ACFWPH_33940 [Nocardia sp. NPDC058499]
MFSHWSYEPLCFRDYARQFRDAVNLSLVLLGGITNLAGMHAGWKAGSSS